MFQTKVVEKIKTHYFDVCTVQLVIIIIIGSTALGGP
jgi:hypothetical protein